METMLLPSCMRLTVAGPAALGFLHLLGTFIMSANSGNEGILHGATLSHRALSVIDMHKIICRDQWQRW